MRTLALIPTLVATLLSGAERPLPSSRQSWKEVRTPQFTVVSDLSDSRTEDLVKDLELFHATLVKVLGQRHLQGCDLKVPAEVVLFSDFSQLNDYSGRTRIGGICYQTERGPAFLMNANHPKSRAFAYHEYLHAYLQASLADFTFPIWVNEGLAGFFEATWIRDGVVKVGTPNDIYFRIIQRGGRLPMSQMIRTPQDFTRTATREFTGRFYASAWFTLHYLQLGAPHRRGQLDAYLWNLKTGFSPEESFVNAFGAPEALDEELETYRLSTAATMPGLTFRALDLKVPPIPPPSPLPRAGALALLGDVLVNLRPTETAWIEAHMNQAFALAPTHPQVCNGKALWALKQGRSQEAQALLQASVATDPSALNAYHVGATLLRRASPAERNSTSAPRLIQAAQQGIGDATSLNHLAVSYTGLPTNLGTALYDLAVAHPAWHAFRKTLTQSCLQMGHLDRARTLATVDAQSSVPGVAQQAEQTLANIADHARKAKEAEVARQTRTLQEQQAQQDEETALGLAAKAVTAVGTNHLAQALDLVQKARKLNVSETLQARLQDLESQILRLKTPAKSARKRA